MFPIVASGQYECTAVTEAAHASALLTVPAKSVVQSICMHMLLPWAAEHLLFCTGDAHGPVVAGRKKKLTPSSEGLAVNCSSPLEATSSCT